MKYNLMIIALVLIIFIVEIGLTSLLTYLLSLITPLVFNCVTVIIIYLIIIILSIFIGGNKKWQ